MLSHTLTAEQFTRLWNELPNPNRCGFEPTGYEVRVLYVPEADLSRQVVSLNEKLVVVQEVRELVFRLDTGRNGRKWVLVTPVNLNR